MCVREVASKCTPVRVHITRVLKDKLQILLTSGLRGWNDWLICWMCCLDWYAVRHQSQCAILLVHRFVCCLIGLQFCDLDCRPACSFTQVTLHIINTNIVLIQQLSHWSRWMSTADNTVLLSCLYRYVEPVIWKACTVHTSTSQQQQDDNQVGLTGSLLPYKHMLLLSLSICISACCTIHMHCSTMCIATPC